MNRFILTLVASFVLSFSLSQEINRQEAPTFTLNAMVLEQASPLVLEGIHLSPDTDYNLILSDPEGEVVFEERVRSSLEGSILFSYDLNQEGIWQVALRGEDARAIFEVEVTPSEVTAATPEIVAETNTAADSQANELSPADASSETDNAETVGVEPAEEIAVVEETAEETSPGETAVSETPAQSETNVETTAPATEDAEAAAVEPENLVTEEPGDVEPGAVEEMTQETTEEATETESAEAVTEEAPETVTTETAEEPNPEAAITEAEPETDATERVEPSTETPVEAEAIAETAQETPSVGEGVLEEVPAESRGEEVSESEVVAQTPDSETEQSEPGSEPEPVVQEPAPVANVDPGSVTALIENDAVLGQVNGETAWRLEFPEATGETLGLVATPLTTFVGHGNSLLELDNANGQVLKRWALAGQITNLSGTADNLTISTQLGSETQTFTLLNGAIAESVQFASEPELFSWLKNEAEVENPEARLEQDPSNPWLALKVAQATNDQTNFSAAVEKGQTFYDLAGIARVLLEAGQDDLANQAMNKALSDFASRGYDPRLLRDLGLHENYNFPLRPLESAIATGDRAKADFWANWLKYFVTPDTPQIAEAMRDYASLVSRQDSRDAAKEWRSISSSGNRTSVATVLENFFAMLGRVGWYGVMALLVAILSLHLTLLFKYWSPQSLFLRRRKAVGRSTGAMPRLFVMRYYSTFEKLVLVLLFASLLLLAGLATWNNESVDSLSIDSGSLNAESKAALTSATLNGERGSFIRGYAAQVTGDTSVAEAEYNSAPGVPAALNNLAALTTNPALYSAALELAPNMLEAKFNSGQEVNAFLFQKAYLLGQPVLAVPSQEDIQAATAGSWQAAVGRTFSNPWTALDKANPLPSWGGSRLPWLSQYVWYLIMILFFLWAAITLIWLFIPRPRLARNAPRNPLYEIMAILIPGSGAADEMWGLLLLIPWAIVGLDTLADVFNWGFGIGLSRRWDYILLVIIYLINLVAVVVEFFSYSNRMRALKRDNEELAREFRLIK